MVVRRNHTLLYTSGLYFPLYQKSRDDLEMNPSLFLKLLVDQLDFFHTEMTLGLR